MRTFKNQSSRSLSHNTSLFISSSPVSSSGLYCQVNKIDVLRTTKMLFNPILWKLLCEILFTYLIPFQSYEYDYERWCDQIICPIQVFAKHYWELKKVFTKEVTANTKWSLSYSHLFLPIRNPYLCPQLTETKIPAREGRGSHYNDSWCLSSLSGLSKWRGSPVASCHPRHFLYVPTPKPLNCPINVYQLSSHDRKTCCREWTSWLKQHFTFSPGTGEQVWEKNARSRHELDWSRKNKV